VQPDGTTAPLLHGIGPLQVPISTTSELAQKYFNQGVTLMYGFNHHEAIRSFKEAARLDPTCGICWWGVALAYGPNINQPMPPKQSLAWQARRRRNRFAPASRRGQAYTTLSRPHRIRWGARALDRAYADAMAKLVAAYPDDLNAATLYAESLMNLSPWDYYRRTAREPETSIVIAQLERVKAANPQHPGALHFYIHAVEATPTPERAEAAADELGDLVPVAGHLVHMPAHIYLRVGRYHDAVTSNELASAADEDYIAQCNAQGFYPAVYYPHNLHFLWYAAMMEGQKKLSLDTARKMAQHVPLDSRVDAEVQQYLPGRSTRWSASAVGRHASRTRAAEGVPFARRCGTTDAASRMRTRATSQGEPELKYVAGGYQIGAKVRSSASRNHQRHGSVATDLLTAAIAMRTRSREAEVTALNAR
jgi:tetratricopeptide (TPR) repeat protein